MSSTGHLSELDLLRSQVADLSRELAERDQSGQDLREQSDLLRAIVAGTAAETGEEFFVSLVTHLTSVLHVQYAIIGEVQGDCIKKIRTLAVSAGGALVENFEYELAHTPCATALTETFACFDRDVQVTFPQFQRLADLGAESYCAVPLRTKGGAVIGLLVVMDTKPLEHSDSLQSLLGVFAPRVTAEFERRRAEQERAQAQADLHNVIEAIPDIVFALNRQGNLVKWNQRVEEVTGYSSAELVGMPALAFVPPEEQLSTIAAIQRAFTEGYAALDSHLLTKDQRLIPYHCTGALLKNSHGEPIGIIGIGRDVSEKKRAEEALRESEERLALAVDGSNDVLWDAQRLPGEPWYAPQTPIWWSPRVRELLGLQESASFETFEQWTARLHPDDKDRVFGQLAAHIEHRVPYDVEYRLRTNRGDYRWVRGRGQALWDEQGEPRRMSGSCQDITEHKRAEEERQKQEVLITLILNTGPTCIKRVAANGSLLHMNPTGLKMVEACGEFEVVERSVFDLVTSEHRDAFISMHRRVIEGHECTLQFEIQGLKGTRRWMESYAAPFRNPVTGQTEHLAVTHDITDRKRAEEALRESEAVNLSVLNSLSSQIVVLNSQGVIMAVNKPWLRFAEENEAFHLVESFVGMNYLNVCAQAPLFANGEEAASAQAGILAVLAGTHNEFSLEYPCHSPDRQRWVRMRVTPLLGSQVGVVVAHENITERKQAEEAMHVSEERLTLAARGSNTGIWDWDLRTNEVYFSPIWKGMLGYEVHELRGEFSEWEARLHPDDRPRALATVRAYLDRATPQYELEHRLRHKDGSYRWVLAHGITLSDAAGIPYRMAGSHIDITERKQAEESLRLAKFSMDQAADAIYWIDPQAKILDVNDAASLMLGYSKDELCALTVHDLNPDFPASLWPGFWAETERRGTMVLETAHRAKDGRLIPIEVSINYLAYEGKEYHCAFVRNITERKRAEHESQERAVEALSLQRALLELAHLDDTKLTFSEVVPRVTKLVADTLAVERVSLWLLSEDRTELVCQDLYECLHAVHSTGSRLSASNYPRYFSAIENSLVVAASDALVDPRTSEFADDYFPSLGITSVLDVPIFRQGALIGVLWCEHVGEPRKWAHEAQDFAVSVGQTIILMMETAERKQVEEALRLTKFAVDRGADMAFWIDRDARISYVNDAACERLGYTREELLAMTVLDFDSECPVSVWAQHWDELKAQKRLRFERTHRTKAGDSYPVEIVANYVMFEGQEYNFAFCRDITDRKRAEEELRKSHSFLRQVIDINPNFIFAKDRDGRFTLANKAVADVYGTMVEDLIGKTDADFNPNQEEVAFFRQKDLAVMDTLQELFFSEEVITDSGGRTRWLQTVKKPILDDEGRAMMVLGSSTDITERKQMEETLRQRERALRAAIEERERISQDLHDGILQSLFAVGLAIEAGKLMLPPTARKTSGASLNQAIDQLNDVMREIRNFIAGLGSDLPEGKDLSMALQHMLALLTKNQATRVRLAVEDRAAKAVSAEQSLHLFRVIQEAVSNCIKHGHAQEAKVSLKMLKQGLRLSIRDNGCGFNPERTNGAGYGLSNMAARAQKIGGRLSVLSKPNEGTSIILDLPATGQGNEAMGT